MSKPRETRASLRLFGDDLDPDNVSALLGQRPTKSERKGDVLVGKVTGQKRTAKTGGWRLRASETECGNLEDQINEVLGKLTDDIEVWRALTTEFDADFFCGIFLETSNDGLHLKAETLQKLGERGLMLDFDIYDQTDD